MSYCVNCGVKLDPSLKECPLCHTPVINPNKPMEAKNAVSPYPTQNGQVEVVKRKDLGILLTVVLTVTSVTCLLLNLLVFDKALWSLLVIGICVCLFVFTFPAVFYSKAPLYISLLADGISVALYLYLITYITPSQDWFWQIGLPVVLILTGLTELYTLLVKFFPVSILSCSLYLFLEIPTFCVALELLICRAMAVPSHITWSAVVLTVCVIIDFALVTILIRKRLRNEVRRRLHF